MKFKPGDKVKFLGFHPGGSLGESSLVPGNPYTVKEYGQPKKGFNFLMVEEDLEWFYDENVFVILIPA